METNRKNVFAAGDVAETTHIVSGTRVWMPFAPVANKMGFVAGSNIGGVRTAFPGTTGNMITKFEEWFVGKVGLSEREAKTVGLKTIGKTIKAKTRARYYPGGKDIYVRLVAEVDTNRLLGAQIVGGEEVLGRLDTVSVALQKRVTVEELFFAEMGYLPAISQVWDPLTVAARQLLKD
jgi:NADPH:sulfur oxidoreductase